MSIYARGTFSSNYELMGDPTSIDCVVGLAFGYRKNGLGSVNERLAEFIANDYADLPIILDKNIGEALYAIDPNITPLATFKGYYANTTGTKGGGTFAELSYVQEVMDEHGLENPLFVAQANHVGRAALQAIKLGMNPIVVQGLPNGFDRHSARKQWWTKNLALWTVREGLGVFALRHRDQL